MTNINKNKKVIIDFGANKGQNINYYLLKADIVVCVEANPKLVKEIQKNLVIIFVTKNFSLKMLSL